MLLRPSHNPPHSLRADEARLLDLATSVHELTDSNEAVFCGPALGPHLPEALGVAAAQLHSLYGQQLAPWLRTGGLPTGWPGWEGKQAP